LFVKAANRGYLAEPSKSIREHVILDTIAIAPSPSVAAAAAAALNHLLNEKVGPAQTREKPSPALNKALPRRMSLRAPSEEPDNPLFLWPVRYQTRNGEIDHVYCDEAKPSQRSQRQAW